MGEDVIGGLFSQVDQAGLGMIEELYAGLATAITPVFIIAMTIYVVWLGYQLMIGKMGLTAGAIIWSIGRMLLIYAMAFYWSSFGPLAAKAAIAGPDAIATVICQSTGGEGCQGSDSTGSSSTTQGLSAIWNAGATVGTNVVQAGGYTGVGLMLAGIVIMVIVGFLVVLAAALLIMTKIALFVLLATAPIFISMALFNFTSGIFSAWLSTILTYALVLPCVVYGILGIMLIFMKEKAEGLMSQTSALGQAENALTVVAPFLVLCGICFYLLLQAKNIAHGIGHGARLDNGSMLRQLTQATKAIGGTANKYATAAAEGTLGAIGSGVGAGVRTLSQQPASLQAAVRASRS